MKILHYFIFFLTISAFSVSAEQHTVIAESRGKMSCIISKGQPDHSMGKFPNRANPNKFQKQKLTFCFPKVPRLTNFVTRGLMTVGVALNGIPIRPYTADYFDPNATRGFSKNPSSGWRKQAMFNPRSLGIDLHNGHVDKSGLYHYHKIRAASIVDKKEYIVGHAPDGFKIMYNESESSSWSLKKGLRSTAPGGKFDGNFEEDFEYISNSGSLDECNGKKINGVYTYFATDTYPFFPRCFKGAVNKNFMRRN